MELVELCVTYLVSARMRAYRLNRPVQRGRVCVRVCIVRGSSLVYVVRDIHARNRYFHACIAAKGQHLRRDAHTFLRVSRYAYAGYIPVQNTHAWKRRVHIRRVVYVVFAEHVRGETISYARTTGEVGERRFSPARYYAGIDNAELVNAFSDQCAPFMDHTRKDPARTSAAVLRPSSVPVVLTNPKCVPFVPNS